METHLETSSGTGGFEKEITAINDAISESGSGRISNIAIIAEPFAGKTTLINEIEMKNPGRTARLTFSSLVKHRDEIAIPEGSIVMIDDCQYLYMQKIGGFDVLEDFLAMVAESRNLFITTWNLYSWTYLDEVMDLAVHFPIQIKLTKLTTDDIKSLILSRYEAGEIQFSGEVESKKKIIERVKHPITLKPLKKEINLPGIKFYFDPLKTWFFRNREMMTIEDIIYRRINNISNGNPGVAKVIWDNSLQYPVIKPEYINDISYEVRLNYIEAFVLSIILSMKSIGKEELDDITGFRTVHILSSLSGQGLIKKEDGQFGIKPEALKSTVEFLKKSRLVW
ncbi:MAG: hypothetical protein P1P72_10030 [ANME-2 cluster archaeon]|nr:hypothetical protein [ANME-2 cluster archaeon]